MGGSVSERRWAILGFGLLVWVISTFLDYALFAIEIYNESYFEFTVIVVSAVVAAICATVYLLSDSWDHRVEALIIGVAWFVLNAVLGLIFSELFSREYELTYTGIGALAERHAYIPVVCLICGFSVRAWLQKRELRAAEVKQKNPRGAPPK